jgi:scyllo-inositol 2-dehydrogenase (NADP+)
VGIIGLGRSGWSIHALGLQQMPEHYRIVAVADLIEARRIEAQQTFGCRSHAGYGELLADGEVGSTDRRAGV